MNILKPRSRMISVRLSEEELFALRELCTLTGARSVSDLTRDAMQSLLTGASSQGALESRIDEFSAQMKNLSQCVDRLSAEITGFKKNLNH